MSLNPENPTNFAVRHSQIPSALLPPMVILLHVEGGRNF